MPQAGQKGVVFVGVGIFPHRVAGDKNFLLELSAHLRDQGIRTSFVSVVTGPCDLPTAEGFRFVNRFLHRPTERFVRRGPDGAIAGYRHAHSTIRTLAELATTIVSARGVLLDALRAYDRAVVHWIDSSLLIPCLRAVCGERHRYVASMLRYLPQNRAATKARAFALNQSEYVFTGTDASRRLLVDEGCCAHRVVVAPWGCAVRPEPVAHPRQGETRLLWSGFLQQIGREDFLRTIHLAHRVRRKRSDVHFTFCLKPECFTSEFAVLAGEGVDVTAGGPGFLRAISSFDGFLSPVSDARSTPAPPLTWLEAFASGVPVITTVHEGIGEVVVDGISGIVAADYADLESRLMDPSLKANLARMRRGALEQHASRYDIRSVSKHYADLYRDLFAGRVA